MWSPKETTLRVIRCPTLQVSQFLFPGQRSDTFLTDLVLPLFSLLPECMTIVFTDTVGKPPNLDPFPHPVVMFFFISPFIVPPVLITDYKYTDVTINGL